MKLYHTTLKENKDSILEKGLIPSKMGIIYLSEKPDSWWQDEDHITFEVDIKNTDKLTTFNEPDLDEVLYWGNIGPERIKLMEKENNGISYIKSKAIY